MVLKMVPAKVPKTNTKGKIPIKLKGNSKQIRKINKFLIKKSN